MLSNHWRNIIFFHFNVFSLLNINTANLQLHLQQQTLPSAGGVSGFEIICIVNGLKPEKSSLRISLYCPSSGTFPCFQACLPVCGSAPEKCEELPYLQTVFCGERYDPNTLQKQIIFRFTNPLLHYFYSRHGFACEFLHIKSQPFYWVTTTSSPTSSSPVTISTTTISVATTSTIKSNVNQDVSVHNVSSTSTNLSTKAVLVSTMEGQLSEKKSSDGPLSKAKSGSAATRHVNLSDLLIAVLILLGTLVTLFLIIFVCVRWILIKHYIGNRNKILMGDLLCMRQTIELQRDKRARLNGAASAFLQERASLQSHQSRRSMARLSTGGGSTCILDPVTGMATVSPECFIPVFTYSNQNDQRTLSQPVVYLPLERLRNDNGTIQWRPLSIVDPHMSHNGGNVVKPLHRSATQLESFNPTATMNGLSFSRNRSGESSRLMSQHLQSRNIEIIRPPQMRSSDLARHVDEAGPSDTYIADYYRDEEEWNRSPDRQLPPVPQHSKPHFLFPHPSYSNHPGTSHFYEHPSDIMSSSYHGCVQPYAEDFPIPINQLHRSNTTAMSTSSSLQKSRDTKRLSRSHSRSLQQGSRLGSHEDILEEDTET